jgi:O-antigen/teichoic acid export membrane protein
VSTVVIDAAERDTWRGSLRQPLYRNGIALVANAGLSSLLGVVYWVVVTHLLPPGAVGVNTALVAAMTALSNAGQLSLGSAVASYVPRTGNGRARLVARCYGLATTASVVLGAAFVFLAPRFVDDLHVLRTPWIAVTFVAGVAVWSLFALQDNVLTALRQAVWVPLENAGYSAAKLLLVVAAGASLGGVGVFVSWVAPALLCIVPVNVVLFRRLLRGAPSGVDGRPPSMPFRRFVTGETSGVLLWQLGTTMLPLLVVARVGAADGARFAIPWLLAQAVDLVAVNMGVSLTVEGAHDHERVRELLRGLLRRCLPVIAAVVAAGVIAAPLVLSVYGSGYGAESATVLRVLLAACLPRAVLVLAICAARAELALGRILVMQSALSVTVPVAAWLLMGSLGVAGAAAGWVVGHLVAAGIALARGWAR